MKPRPLIVLAACAALTAWVSAQPGYIPTASESLRMLKANRGLYEDLSASALLMADRNTSLDRVDECLKVADRLSREAREAIDRNDGDRLAEVSDHIHTVATEGLVPNLSEARRDIAPQSEDYRRLQDVHQLAFDNLTRTANAVPTEGDLATSDRVRVAREKLAAAAAEIGPPPPDEK